MLVPGYKYCAACQTTFQRYQPNSPRSPPRPHVNPMLGHGPVSADDPDVIKAERDYLKQLNKELHASVDGAIKRLESGKNLKLKKEHAELTEVVRRAKTLHEVLWEDNFALRELTLLMEERYLGLASFETLNAQTEAQREQVREFRIYRLGVPEFVRGRQEMMARMGALIEELVLNDEGAYQHWRDEIMGN